MSIAGTSFYLSSFNASELKQTTVNFQFSARQLFQIKLCCTAEFLWLYHHAILMLHTTQIAVGQFIMINFHFHHVLVFQIKLCCTAEFLWLYHHAILTIPPCNFDATHYPNCSGPIHYDKFPFSSCAFVNFKQNGGTRPGFCPFAHQHRFWQHRRIWMTLVLLFLSPSLLFSRRNSLFCDWHNGKQVSGFLLFAEKKKLCCSQRATQ